MYPQRDDSREMLGAAVALFLLFFCVMGVLYMLQRFLLELAAFLLVRLFGRWMPTLPVGIVPGCELISKGCCLVVAATSMVLMIGVPAQYKGSESDLLIHEYWMWALVTAIVTQLYASIAWRLDVEKPQLVRSPSSGRSKHRYRLSKREHERLLRLG
jgi:hypothetical protein